MKSLLLMILISLTATSVSAQQAYTPVEGVNYHELETPVQTTGKIQVAEFFWYGCPHCFTLEPYLNDWLSALPSDVEFVRIPATFNRPNVLMHAKTYYSLEQMGMVEQHHELHHLGPRLAQRGRCVFHELDPRIPGGVIPDNLPAAIRTVVINDPQDIRGSGLIYKRIQA